MPTNVLVRVSSALGTAKTNWVSDSKTPKSDQRSMAWEANQEVPDPFLTIFPYYGTAKPCYATIYSRTHGVCRNFLALTLSPTTPRLDFGTHANSSKSFYVSRECMNRASKYLGGKERGKLLSNLSFWLPRRLASIMLNNRRN